MRMMLRMTIPVESGNKAIADGTLPKVLEQTLAKLKPEATYFCPDATGLRVATFVFDMTDSSEIPAICEPLFMQLNASVTVAPCMNLEDLQKGLKATGRM